METITQDEVEQKNAVFTEKVAVDAQQKSKKLPTRVKMRMKRRTAPRQQSERDWSQNPKRKTLLRGSVA